MSHSPLLVATWHNYIVNLAGKNNDIAYTTTTSSSDLHIPTNPQTNFCLSFVEKLLDMGTFLLENAACLSNVWALYIPGPHKNVGIGNFCEGSTPFLLDIKQKAGWLVGMPT